MYLHTVFLLWQLTMLTLLTLTYQQVWWAHWWSPADHGFSLNRTGQTPRVTKNIFESNPNSIVIIQKKLISSKITSLLAAKNTFKQPLQIAVLGLTSKQVYRLFNCEHWGLLLFYFIAPASPIAIRQGHLPDVEELGSWAKWAGWPHRGLWSTPGQQFPYLHYLHAANVIIYFLYFFFLCVWLNVKMVGRCRVRRESKGQG